jgi:hypothetical protein
VKQGKILGDWPAILGILALIAMVAAFVVNQIFAQFLQARTLIGVASYSAVPGLYLLGAMLLIISILKAKE